MLYFKKDLVENAKSIMRLKGTKDDADASAYFVKINNVINCYCYDFKNYNSYYAITLDNEIRKKYSVISNLENYPVNVSNNTSNQKNQSSNEPEEIRRLNVDQYGIMLDVLIKHKKLRCLEDFIESFSE